VGYPALRAWIKPHGRPVARVAVRRRTVAKLTIRQLDERTHVRLRARAARHGRSVEAEVRAILDTAVDLPEENTLLAVQAAMSEDGGVDLPLERRTDLPRSV